MTQPNAGGARTAASLSSAEARALATAIADGFAEAVQAPFTTLANLLRQANESHAELVAAVDRLAALIATQAAGDIDPDDAPDIEMPIGRFHSFDWAQIAAHVLVEDEYGPAIVNYGGKAFKRRSPDNQYDPAIWFSRCVGKDDKGNNKYVRLITFKPMADKVEPLGRKAEKATAGSPAVAATSVDPRPPAPRPAAPPPTPPQPPAVRQPAPAAATPAQPPAPAAPPAEQPAQPALPEEPDWTESELTAEEEFESWTSASEGKPPLQPKTQQAGPRVNGGASRDDNAPAAGVPAASAPIAGGASTPKPAAPAAPPPGRRQATIGAGEVYTAFTKWSTDFARRYQHYRVAKTDRTDPYHIMLTIYMLGETEDRQDSRFAYIRDLATLNEAIAAMEQHAATHHADGKHAN